MVRFELGKEIGKNVFLSCHEFGTKKTFRVPMKNRTSDLRDPRSDALPLSHRDSTVSEVYYEVHMTHFLHTARISNVDSVMFENSVCHVNFVRNLAYRGVLVAQW